MKRIHYLIPIVAAVFLMGLGGGAMAADSCPLCGMALAGNENTAMVITMKSGEEVTYCCPHCGLWVLAAEKDQVKSAKVRDFIKGEWLDAAAATYLFNSKAVPACSPSWLAFGSKKEIEMFQEGFGGTIYRYDDALTERAKHPKGMEMPK